MKKEQRDLAESAIANAANHTSWLAVMRFGLDQLMTEPAFLVETLDMEICKRFRNQTIEDRAVAFCDVMKELGLKFSAVSGSAPAAEQHEKRARVQIQKPAANFDNLSPEDAAIMAYEVPRQGLVEAMGPEQRAEHDAIMRRRADIKSYARRKERMRTDPDYNAKIKAYKNNWYQNQKAAITPQQLQQAVTAIQGK